MLYNCYHVKNNENKQHKKQWQGKKYSKLTVAYFKNNSVFFIVLILRNMVQFIG